MNRTLNEMKQIWIKADNEKHTENCWKWHPRCAIAMLINIIETNQTQTQTTPTPTPQPEPPTTNTPQPTPPATPNKRKGRPPKPKPETK